MVISFEEQGKVTEVLLSLSGENRIALDEQELYLLSDLLELEVLLKALHSKAGLRFRKYTKNLKTLASGRRRRNSSLLPYIWLRFICVGTSLR